MSENVLPLAGHTGERQKRRVQGERQALPEERKGPSSGGAKANLQAKPKVFHHASASPLQTMGCFRALVPSKILGCPFLQAVLKS